VDISLKFLGEGLLLSKTLDSKALWPTPQIILHGSWMHIYKYVYFNLGVERAKLSHLKFGSLPTSVTQWLPKGRYAVTYKAININKRNLKNNSK